MNSFCLSRISKDLKEISKSPLEGIGIVSLENDPMKYIVNMKIMSGIFEGYCIQLLLTFPDNYPIQPPRILIYPGQCLDNTYHHHIFDSDLTDEQGRHFNKFCFDLLENDFLPTSSIAHTGWNPSYTISTLLLQVQTFLINPDFPNGYIPEKEKIDILMKSMDTYEKSFTLKNDKNENIKRVHTWKNPYPEMYFKNSLNKINNNTIENKQDDKINSFNKIKENLTCFISRLNYIDNRNIILGYPIQKLRNGALLPIPEVLSYESFIEQSSKKNNSYNNGFYGFNYLYFNLLDDEFFLNPTLISGPTFFPNRTLMIQRTLNTFLFNENNDSNYYHYNSGNSYKSANNELYDSWLPIYINDENFEKNETTILNYFSILKFGNSGEKKFDFHPKYIFEIMINILSEMIKKIIDKNFSTPLLTSFFQYCLMFKKLEKKYNDTFKEYKKFYLEYSINELKKTKIQRGCFDLKKNLLGLLILFLFSDEKLNDDMKKKIKNYILQYKTSIISYIFKTKIIDNIFNIGSLIKDLKKFNLLDGIFSAVYSELKGYSTETILYFNFLKEEIIQKMEKNFIDFYNSLYTGLKEKINKIIFNKINILDYFNMSYLIDSNTLNKSYEIISVFHLLREKLISEDFLKNLENNFGIYLESNNFVEELKNKIYSNTLKKSNILEIYDLFSIKELNILDSLYRKKFEGNNNNGFSRINSYYYCFKRYLFHDIPLFNKEIDNLIRKEKFKYNMKHIKKEMKVCNKEKVQKDKIFIKNSYDKTYNKRLNKYINKNNINRLLLFKRHHY